MKILILRSTGPASPRPLFSMVMDTAFAGRVLGHLSDSGTFCSSCAAGCTSCRKGYDLDFSRHIAGIVDFPSVVPAILEDPEMYLPQSIPDADVVLSIAVNEEILVAFVERFTSFAGLIAPLEAPDWITPNAIKRITRICTVRGVEVSFPRPFCTFDPQTPVLKRAHDLLRIGKPSAQYEIADGMVISGTVLVSAPCGATYFTVQGMKGRRCDERLDLLADARLSAYPCTASTAVDRETRDSLIHLATQVQRCIVPA